jgi:hypothetical protein
MQAVFGKRYLHEQAHEQAAGLDMSGAVLPELAERRDQGKVVLLATFEPFDSLSDLGGAEPKAMHQGAGRANGRVARRNRLGRRR